MWLASRVTKALGYSTRHREHSLALLGMPISITRVCTGTRRSGPNIVFLHVGSLDVQVVSRATESGERRASDASLYDNASSAFTDSTMIIAKVSWAVSARVYLPPWREGYRQ